MSVQIKPIGGCSMCEKCEWVRGKYFCGKTKLTDKQLHNRNGYCSGFVPKRKLNREDGEA